MQEREDGTSDEDDVLDAVTPFEVVRDEPLPVTPTLKHAYPVPGASAMTVVTLQQQQAQQPQPLQQRQHLLQHQQLNPLQQQREHQHSPPQQQQQQPPTQQRQPCAPPQQCQPPAQQQTPSYPKLSRLEQQASLTEELALVRETKVICSLDLLLELFKTCHHSGCGQPLTPKHHLVGPTVIINWTCPHGHTGKFSSSKDINEMYTNNLQVAASILLSGNNFTKIERMCSFLGLSFISNSTFFRMQRLYLIPCINEWWNWQRDQLLEEFKNVEVVVCGDGQCDSPGHTAKNLCYFLMELVSDYILEVEVRDKRHVGLASTNMERQALQNALQRLRSSINIVEVVTDASTSIKKMIGKIQLTCIVVYS